MALIKCPECSKEISDTCKKCPNCGYKLKKKISSKVKTASLGIVCIASIAGGIGYYTYTHVKVNSKEMAIIKAIRDVKSSILNPESLIIYDCQAGYYDFEKDGLMYRLDAIPEYLSQDVVQVYLHIGSENKMGGISEMQYVYVYDEEFELIMKDDNSSDISTSWYESKLNLDSTEWEILEDEEIDRLFKLAVLNKIISIENTFPTISDEKVNDIISSYIQICLENEEFDVAREYATRAVSNLVSEELLEEIEDRVEVLATTAFEDEQFDKAFYYFNQCSDIALGEEKINECNYAKALNMLESENYDEAYSVFESIRGYSDSSDMLKECMYQKANKMLAEADGLYDFDRAAEVFESIKTYKDSEVMINECFYQKAMLYCERQQYDEAISVLEQIVEYADSKDKIEQFKNLISEKGYQKALGYQEEGDYAKAANEYKKLEDYKDSKTRMNECYYQKALSYYEEQQYDLAKEWLNQVTEHENKESLINEIKKNEEMMLLEKKYQEAIEELVAYNSEKAQEFLKEHSNYKEAQEYLDAFALAESSPWEGYWKYTDGYIHYIRIIPSINMEKQVVYKIMEEFDIHYERLQLMEDALAVQWQVSKKREDLEYCDYLNDDINDDLSIASMLTITEANNITENIIGYETSKYTYKYEKIGNIINVWRERKGQADSIRSYEKVDVS